MSVLAPWHRRAALEALRAGGVIACPTESVWGLSCDAANATACERLMALKRRDWRKGLIVVAADFSQLEAYVRRPSNTAMKRAEATWPGPHTWVFPIHEDAPPWLTGTHDSLAVRVTAHPLLRELCLGFGGALVSTSANPSGRDPARDITRARLYFNHRVQAFVPGALGGLERPTTIRSVVTGAILRR